MPIGTQWGVEGEGREGNSGFTRFFLTSTLLPIARTFIFTASKPRLYGVNRHNEDNTAYTMRNTCDR